MVLGTVRRFRNLLMGLEEGLLGEVVDFNESCTCLRKFQETYNPETTREYFVEDPYFETYSVDPLCLLSTRLEVTECHFDPLFCSGSKPQSSRRDSGTRSGQ